MVRSAKVANYATSSAPAQPEKDSAECQRIHLAVSDAMAAVCESQSSKAVPEPVSSTSKTTSTRCPPSQVEEVIRATLPLQRQPEAKGMADAVLAKLAGAECTPQMLAEALVESGMGSTGATRVCRREALVFQELHGGMTKAEFFASSVQKAVCFRALSLILLIFSVGLLGISGYEASVAQEEVNVSSRVLAGFICLLASLLTLTAIVGIVGTLRLRKDLQTDADGRDSVAQLLLEFYFHNGLFCCVLCLALGIAHLSIAAQDEASVTHQGQLFPHAYKKLAASIDINSQPNTGRCACSS